MRDLSDAAFHDEDDYAVTLTDFRARFDETGRLAKLTQAIVQ